MYRVILDPTPTPAPKAAPVANTPVKIAPPPAPTAAEGKYE